MEVTEDTADSSSKSFTAAVLVVVRGFAVGATLSNFAAVVVSVVVVVGGSGDGGYLSATADDTVVEGLTPGVSSVLVLAESGSADFTGAEREEVFDSEETTEGGVDERGLPGGSGAVAVTWVVAHVDCDKEDSKETWADTVCVLVTGAEQTTWVAVGVDADTGRGGETWGAGAAGAWTEADADVETSSVVGADV